MNSKLLFKNTLQVRNTGRPVFVPFVYGLAARISQISLRDMVHDPTYFANSLEAACKLFKYDGITNTFDSSIEAEACGCELTWTGDYELPVITKGYNLDLQASDDFIKSGRIPILIEVTKRLGISMGKEVAIIGVVAGPLSLIKNLVPEFDERPDLDIHDPEIQRAINLSADFLKKYIKSLCELKVDAVFIREDILKGDIVFYLKTIEEIYTTLFNIIRFYNSYPLLIVKNFELKGIQQLYGLLRPSGIILFGNRFNEANLQFLKGLSESLGMCFGLPIPFGDQNELWGQLDLINTFIIENDSRGFFFISDREIPFDIPAETLLKVASKILKEFST